MTLIIRKIKKGKPVTQTHRGIDAWTKAYKAWDQATRNGQKLDFTIDCYKK